MGNGEPTKLEINAYLRPSGLIWSPDSELLWTVGVPETLLGPANITAVQVESEFSPSPRLDSSSLVAVMLAGLNT